MEKMNSMKDRQAVREFLFLGTRMLSVLVPEPEPKEFLIRVPVRVSDPNRLFEYP